MDGMQACGVSQDVGLPVLEPCHCQANQGVGCSSHGGGHGEIPQGKDEKAGDARSSEGPGHDVPEESRPWVSAKIPMPKHVMGLTEPTALKDVSSGHEDL